MRSRHLLVGGLVLCAAGSAFGVTNTDVQLSDLASAAPLKFADLLTFNWRILNQVNNSITVPATPTGTPTSEIRLFSNGNKNNFVGVEATVWSPDGPNSGSTTTPPNYPDTFNVDGFGGGGVPFGSASLFYGLQYGNGQNPTISGATTVSDIIGFIQSSSNYIPNSIVSPIFAFDQNQEGSDPDIFLRGRLLLVDPSLIALDDTLTGPDVDAILAGATSSQVRTFNFFDDGTSGVPASERMSDDPLLTGDDDAWVLLPGSYDPDAGGNAFTPVNNNGAGNNADWGGVLFDGLNPLDLRNVKANDGTTSVGTNWIFLLDLEALHDNNGKEEAYILGGLITKTTEPPNGVVPEPATVGLLGLAGASLAGLALRRRR